MASIEIFCRQSGYITSSNLTYATARSGGTLSAVTNAPGNIGQDYNTPTLLTYYCVEGFYDFDTSILSGATISSATLRMYMLSTNPQINEFTLEARLYDFGTSITTADYVPGASLSGNTLLATWNDANFTTAQRYNFTDVAMVANINQSGFTRMVLASDRLRLATTPTGKESRGPQPSSGGISLVISYTPASVVSPAAFTPLVGEDDGYITSSASTYASARIGTGSLSSNTLNENNYVGQDAFSDKSGTTYFVYQNFYRFDTSVLAGKTITAATLSIYLTNDQSATNFTINARLHSWGPTLTTADFDPPATSTTETLLATLATSSFSGNGSYNFTDVAMAANINQSGYTEIALVSSRQEGNNTGGGDYVATSSIEGSRRPTLTITFTGGTIRLRALMGAGT